MKKSRNTRQRQIVLDAVLGRTDHPTAEDLYEEIHGKHASISRATVYRNLNILASQGKISQVFSASGACRYDYQVKKHYHLQCKNCGQISNVSIPYMENLDQAVEGPDDWSLLGHLLVFRGYCSDCMVSMGDLKIKKEII